MAMVSEGGAIGTGREALMGPWGGMGRTARTANDDDEEWQPGTPVPKRCGIFCWRSERLL